MNARCNDASAHGPHSWGDGEPCPYCGADLLTGREPEHGVPDPLAVLITNYLRLYVLPANYGEPLYGQTHDDVSKNCGPLLAEVVREHIAESQ